MTGKAAVMNMINNRKETAAEVAASLAEFSEAASLLSSEQPRFIDEYPDKWIAVARAGVQASAENLDDLLAEVDRLGIPRSKVIVHLIERKPRTLIL